VLRSHSVQRARQKCCNAEYAPHAVPHHLNQSVQFGKSEWTCSNEEWSMTQLQTCQLFRVTKKSVRQCARRRVRHVGVAQASPLFSDHAPREVHLWQ
jgi:hypothetical protein